jgi:DNA-binding cell septation regulator SpoVG
MTASTEFERRRADAATLAPRPDTAEEHVCRQARLKKWMPRRSGALLGFCSVQLPSGLVINGLRVMTGADGLWIASPAQKQVDRAGQPRRDANGKQIYSQIVEFKDKPTADRFRDLILDLVHRQYPGDLEGGAS